MESEFEGKCRFCQKPTNDRNPNVPTEFCCTSCQQIFGIRPKIEENYDVEEEEEQENKPQDNQVQPEIIEEQTKQETVENQENLYEGKIEEPIEFSKINDAIKVEAIEETKHENTNQNQIPPSYPDAPGPIPPAFPDNTITAPLADTQADLPPQDNNIQAPPNPPFPAPPEQHEEEEDWMCSICMEELHDPVSTPCGHVFCRRCIEEWLLRSNVCPSCNRPDITKGDLITILGQGQVEDRPEPDNALKFNRWYHKLFRYLRKDTKTVFALVCLIISFFVQ